MVSIERKAFMWVGEKRGAQPSGLEVELLMLSSAWAKSHLVPLISFETCI